MDHLLESYISQPPEIVFEWNDNETGARGWAVINSLRNGAAGGGTRMRKGLIREEVEALAKVMEVKFTVSGPPIGGAKSGIDFDPDDPRRREVLERWFAAVTPLLERYYGTGGDLNVDELKDVIPITEELGLWHPQEGIVQGHMKPGRGQRLRALGQLRYGCTKVIADRRYTPDPGGTYAVADMATGWGVAEAVRHYYKTFRQRDLKGKRVIVQGWGNVASAAAFYLSKSGAKIVGIIDRAGGIIDEQGLGQERVRQLFLTKNGNKLSAVDMLGAEEVNRRIWDVPTDIFIPGAASRLVSKDQVERMMANGLELISCGANVPFTDDRYFFGPTAAFADGKLGLIPDFIANCGMARAFAFLMQEKVEINDQALFKDISEVIGNALKEVYSQDRSGQNISKTALQIALQKITSRD